MAESELVYFLKTTIMPKPTYLDNLKMSFRNTLLIIL